VTEFVGVLPSKVVERVWGCTQLPSGFQAFETGAAIGEIWHESCHPDPELLVKHIFTSERLSIQVHPGDDAARACGYKRGKDEAWLVVHAEPGAVIGLGLKREVSRAELVLASVSGDIENLLDWRPVTRGDFFYSPAGTVHAIGAGLTVIEIQQNLDLTYRLYDYGRPRELHVEDGVSVADLKPWVPVSGTRALGMGRSILIAGHSFTVEEWLLDQQVQAGMDGLELLFIPVEGSGFFDGQAMVPGSVFSGTRVVTITPERHLKLLVAYASPDFREGIFSRDLRDGR
jgi:mannose-6-phosphate isomerase